jgi:hypothetical protein
MLYKKLKADGKAALEARNMAFIMAKGMEVYFRWRAVRKENGLFGEAKERGKV